MSTQNKLFVEDLNLSGKRVIVRVDFNVPLKDGVVESDKRLKESLPTIKYLRDKGAKTILMSHLGRPDGKRVPDQSLAPVAKALGALLGTDVKFADDCVGEPAKAAVAALKAGDVLLLENLRFHAAEEANDPAFAKQLAELADVYVNDAFGSAHRAHASTEGIVKFVPQAASGYLMKSTADRELVQAVRMVARGEVFVQPSAARVLAKGARRREEHASDRARFEKLTERERAVMQLIAEGYTAPEIGEQLTISPKTVDTYKQRINDKLGLTHRADYVKLALRLGLLQTPP